MPDSSVGIALRLVGSAFAALFLTGAIVTPILHPHLAGRIASSLGLVAVFNGVECVVRLGIVSSCGWLSGNCSVYDMRFPAFVLFCALGIWSVRRGLRT